MACQSISVPEDGGQIARLRGPYDHRDSPGEEEDAYVLELRLAFAEKEEVDVRQAGDQLVVQVANQRSNYILPNFLNYYTMTDAALEDGWLHVHFAPDAEPAS